MLGRLTGAADRDRVGGDRQVPAVEVPGHHQRAAEVRGGEGARVVVAHHHVDGPDRQLVGGVHQLPPAVAEPVHLPRDLVARGPPDLVAPAALVVLRPVLQRRSGAARSSRTRGRRAAAGRRGRSRPRSASAGRRPGRPPGRAAGVRRSRAARPPRRTASRARSSSRPGHGRRTSPARRRRLTPGCAPSSTSMLSNVNVRTCASWSSSSASRAARAPRPRAGPGSRRGRGLWIAQGWSVI